MGIAASLTPFGFLLRCLSHSIIARSPDIQLLRLCLWHISTAAPACHSGIVAFLTLFGSCGFAQTVWVLPLGPCHCNIALLLIPGTYDCPWQRQGISWTPTWPRHIRLHQGPRPVHEAAADGRGCPCSGVGVGTTGTTPKEEARPLGGCHIAVGAECPI